MSSQWDWLPKTAIACWVISFGGRLMLMVSGGTSSIERANLSGFCFDWVGGSSSHRDAADLGPPASAAAAGGSVCLNQGVKARPHALNRFALARKRFIPHF
jgi:hypothetical protein